MNNLLRIRKELNSWKKSFENSEFVRVKGIRAFLKYLLGIELVVNEIIMRVALKLEEIEALSVSFTEKGLGKNFREICPGIDSEMKLRFELSNVGDFTRTRY